ncbi:MAG: DsbA family protein [Saprospiraceae bacterium]|nr:DsbA family protein [Saprospiraceae bacterium]
MLSGQKDTLIYIGDPMCSWCYGFIPELDQLKKLYPEIEFSLVLGGLRAGGTERMADLKGFLREHWQEVHDRTGQEFSYSILDNESMIYNTEFACRAVMTVKLIKPELAYEYFKRLQVAFYKNNLDATSVATFKGIATDVGIDKDVFEKIYMLPSTIQSTQTDFANSARMGVRGFPALLLKKDGSYFTISNGFKPYTEMKAKVDALR